MHRAQKPPNGLAHGSGPPGFGTQSSRGRGRRPPEKHRKRASEHMPPPQLSCSQVTKNAGQGRWPEPPRGWPSATALPHRWTHSLHSHQPCGGEQRMWGGSQRTRGRTGSVGSKGPAHGAGGGDAEGPRGLWRTRVSQPRHCRPGASGSSLWTLSCATVSLCEMVSGIPGCYPRHASKSPSNL